MAIFFSKPVSKNNMKLSQRSIGHSIPINIVEN